jgi:hypothetical protein
LTPAKKNPMYPGSGGIQRKKSSSHRTRAVATDVTAKEKQLILKHCLKHKISVSAYLADLALADAAQNNAQDEEEFTLKLPYNQVQQLRLLARVKQKSANDLIAEFVTRPLANKQPHGSLETENIRFYLNEEEHEILRKHVANKGVSTRNYVALLALEDIAQESKPSKKILRKKK